MTNNEKYSTILDTLADAIKEKNDTISLYKWQIAGLEQKLKEAEKAASESQAKSDGVLCGKRIEYRGEHE